jgi:DNA-binding SARP family transcriptional activator
VVTAAEVLRVWICGAVVLERGPARVEIPPGQARTLFAFLAADRHHAHAREELIDVLWPADPPSAADGNLSALLSRLRKLVGDGAIVGRSELQLAVPFDTWIDLEAAREALDRATGSLAAGDPTAALPASHVAAVISARPFLPGTHGPWVDGTRSRLDEMLARAHECSAEAALLVGGGEIPTAERSALALMDRAPYRESGYRYAMRCLAARGNYAEALSVYERCRAVLRDELGVDPGPELQELHLEILRAAG